MNYFNIEKVRDVFKLFEKTEFNTYGVLLTKVADWILYSGNFWWMRGDYAKTINIENVIKIRFNAEVSYIQNGIGWQPYSPYNREGENHYTINFKEAGYR